ncbi:MAG: (S)-2-hydroxyglutarate dehydrogenase [Acidimicrobiia bacterium]|jgi:L-2-hydroxyglutarate oxidase|nr:(S)-2-hydroxyglutarate dehydrogenase [Acidimicrobiia bacterium]
MPHREKVDVVIVGAGIIGLATTRALLEDRPDLSITVLEKESAIARHQTGNNSGVIHAGLYYRPGSLKAQLTLRGRAELIEFCREQGIRHEICGKLVVATSHEELPQLDALAERAHLNGVPATRLGSNGLREHEPHVAGLAGLHVPSTGIIDFSAVCDALAEQLVDKGQELRLDTPVSGLSEESTEVIVETAHGYVSGRVLVNCAGLQSDVVANMAPGAHTDVRIMPFRGEYYKLRPHRRHLVRNLIYPVPDPRFPFLGVHFTRMIAGGIEAGPNAVPALAREGYSWRKVNLHDAAEIATARSTRVLARRYWRTQLGEFHRSLSKAAFVRALQRLVPEVTKDDLVRGGAGVRAQAIAPDGALLDDFAITETARMIHVVNAPSPAATASFAIGRHLARLVHERLG